MTGDGFYLRHTYEVGPDAGTHDHVGPFLTASAAVRHRATYGPIRANIVPLDAHPSPCMTPEEHRIHQIRRSDAF